LGGCQVNEVNAARGSIHNESRYLALEHEALAAYIQLIANQATLRRIERPLAKQGISRHARPDCKEFAGQRRPKKMIKLTLTLLAAAALTLPLNAQSVKIDAPFEFAVGSTTAPAGQYVIRYQAGSPVMSIAGADWNNKYYTNLLGAVEGSNRAAQEKLIFNRYGDQYFLAEIWTRTSRISVPKTRTERELASRNVTAALVALPVSQSE
jgi:hypothetical protein